MRLFKYVLPLHRQSLRVECPWPLHFTLSYLDSAILSEQFIRIIICIFLGLFSFPDFGYASSGSSGDIVAVKVDVEALLSQHILKTQSSLEEVCGLSEDEFQERLEEVKKFNDLVPDRALQSFLTRRLEAPLSCFLMNTQDDKGQIFAQAFMKGRFFNFFSTKSWTQQPDPFKARITGARFICFAEDLLEFSFESFSSLEKIIFESQPVFGFGSVVFSLPPEKKYLGKAGIEALQNALIGNESVTHIDLSGQNLEDWAFPFIVKILKTCHIKGINLKGNCFGEAGINVFLEGLNDYMYLEEIDLSDNPIDESTIQVLCRAIGWQGHSLRVIFKKT